MKKRKKLLIALFIIVVIICLVFVFIKVNAVKKKENLEEKYTEKKIYEVEFSDESKEVTVNNVSFKLLGYKIDDNQIQIMIRYKNIDEAKKLYNFQAWNYFYDDENLIAYSISGMADLNEQNEYRKLYLSEKYGEEEKSVIVSEKINGIDYILEDFTPEDEAYLVKTITLITPDGFELKGNIRLDMLDIKYQNLDDENIYSIDEDNLSIVRINFNLN